MVDHLKIVNIRCPYLCGDLASSCEEIAEEPSTVTFTSSSFQHLLRYFDQNDGRREIERVVQAAAMIFVQESASNDRSLRASSVKVRPYVLQVL